MLRHPIISFIFLLSALALNACEGEMSATPSDPLLPSPTAAPVFLPSTTPDPCTPDNLPTQVESVHKLMREFDDASQLAFNTPQNQLNPSIAELQRIRRAAEEQQFPPCLATLKSHQLAHMNTVINTLLGFLSGADPEVLNESVALARQQHDEYTLELTSLLGLTLVAKPVPEIVDGTPVATFTPTPLVLFVSNPGPTAINIRAQPELEAETLGILDVGLSAVVLGRSADGFWFQIKVPGQPSQKAWVYAPLVKRSDPGVDLPVIDPSQ